jgi:hypothetical protein
MCSSKNSFKKALLFTANKQWSGCVFVVCVITILYTAAIADNCLPAKNTEIGK